MFSLYTFSSGYICFKINLERLFPGTYIFARLKFAGSTSYHLSRLPGIKILVFFLVGRLLS